MQIYVSSTKVAKSKHCNIWGDNKTFNMPLHSPTLEMSCSWHAMLDSASPRPTLHVMSRTFVIGLCQAYWMYHVSRLYPDLREGVKQLLYFATYLGTLWDYKLYIHQTIPCKLPLHWLVQDTRTHVICLCSPHHTTSNTNSTESKNTILHLLKRAKIWAISVIEYEKSCPFIWPRFPVPASWGNFWHFLGIFKNFNIILHYLKFCL